MSGLTLTLNCQTEEWQRTGYFWSVFQRITPPEVMPRQGLVLPCEITILGKLNYRSLFELLHFFLFLLLHLSCCTVMLEIPESVCMLGMFLSRSFSSLSAIKTDSPAFGPVFVRDVCFSCMQTHRYIITTTGWSDRGQNFNRDDTQQNKSHLKYHFSKDSSHIETEEHKACGDSERWIFTQNPKFQSLYMIRTLWNIIFSFIGLVCCSVQTVMNSMCWALCCKHFGVYKLYLIEIKRAVDLSVQSSISGH